MPPGRPRPHTCTRPEPGPGPGPGPWSFEARTCDGLQGTSLHPQAGTFEVEDVRRKTLQTRSLQRQRLFLLLLYAGQDGVQVGVDRMQLP